MTDLKKYVCREHGEEVTIAYVIAVSGGPKDIGYYCSRCEDLIRESDVCPREEYEGKFARMMRRDKC